MLNLLSNVQKKFLKNSKHSLSNDIKSHNSEKMGLAYLFRAVEAASREVLDQFLFDNHPKIYI